jgi:multiple sugar transport system substrate-binding protein
MGCKEPGLAMAMARFMTDPDTWTLSARANAGAFAPPGVYAGTYTGNRIADRRIMTEVYKPTGKKSFDEAVRVILEVADHAVTLPPSNAGKQVMEAMTRGVNAALLGPQDPESAMKSAAREAQLALGPPPPDYDPDWPPGLAQRSPGVRRGLFEARRR